MMNSETASRLPSLNGWRALSIIMVLGGHTGLVVAKSQSSIIDWIFDGYLGVRFFFVISGFLITWLLLQELRGSGKVHLKHFYARRFLRILPVYFTFVLVLLALQFFTRFKETPAGWLGMLTFTRNFTDGSGPSGHFWSLSVEEQFYFVWPGLLVLLTPCSVRTKATALAIPILTAPIFRLGAFIFHSDHEHLFKGANGIHLHPAFLEIFFLKYSFFCQFDTLAFGCLGAVLLAHEWNIIAAVFRRNRRLIFYSALLLVAVPHVMWELTPPRMVALGFMTFGPTLQASGFLFLLCQSLIEPEWGGYRMLNWKWIGWIGVLSYSLYIWQQIFCLRAWAGEPLAAQAPDRFWPWLWLLPTFAVAIISYYGLERPFLGCDRVFDMLMSNHRCRPNSNMNWFCQVIHRCS